jgi:hypothetical protein
VKEPLPGPTVNQHEPQGLDLQGRGPVGVPARVLPFMAHDGCASRLPPPKAGYDGAMSESTPDTGPSSENTTETSSGTDTGSGSGGGDSDDRLIPDDKLPDDLNPEKNPLAREPDEDAEGGFSPNGPDAAADAPG